MKRKEKLFGWRNLPVNRPIGKLGNYYGVKKRKGVKHVDRFFQLTDQKLAFDQHQLTKRMMELITKDNMSRYEVDELELATELCAQYTEVISQRQVNYEKQCTINQLDLFNP